MSKILIPRSDSVSAKVIEPSDFEKLFSQDLLRDYIETGFTVTAGSGLAVNVAIGELRLKGLHVHNTTSESVTGLSANTTNHIYVVLSRDTNSEAESWDFVTNTSGSDPTDSIKIATAVTGSSSVSSVNSSIAKTSPNDFKDVYEFWFGDGADGDVTISTNTTFNTPKDYNNLTVNSGNSLTYNGSSTTNAIIRVRDTLTVNGTISATGKGRSGGSGGGGGGGGDTGSSSWVGGGGTSGTAGEQSYGASLTGGDGGGGGSGGSSPMGGGGGGASATSGVTGDSRIIPDTRFNDARELLLAQPQIYGSGGSGGSGGHGGASQRVSGLNGGVGGSGGTGGDGGGTLYILARNIVIDTSGIIESNGNDGSNGASGGSGATSCGGGGGGGSGGGGSGGFIGIIYESITNNGNINVNGGSTGSGGSAGASGGSGGSAGSAGGTGGSGAAGVKKELQIPTYS